MKKILYILIPIIIVAFFLSRSGNNDEYAQTIKEYRADREDFFKNSEASPFVQKETQYSSLDYYEPDPTYKVTAKLDKLTKRELISISNSDGSTTKYLKFAVAKFKLKDATHSLLILKALGFGSQYLTAFADETSGDSTYGGGRYLDLDIGKSNRVEIDFNKAYNPYCAYFGDFLCPFPPKENILSITIEAGEKDYKGSL